MNKSDVMDLAELAKGFWSTSDHLNALIAANALATAVQDALWRTASAEGYADALEEALGWPTSSDDGSGEALDVDWDEARRIAEALEAEAGGHSGPWPKLYVEGTLCYAHQTVHEGNLDLFKECWDATDLPRWSLLEKRQKIVAVLRSARAHFSADLDLAADDFTTRLNPATSGMPEHLLRPVPQARAGEHRLGTENRRGRRKGC